MRLLKILSVYCLFCSLFSVVATVAMTMDGRQHPAIQRRFAGKRHNGSRRFRMFAFVSFRLMSNEYSFNRPVVLFYCLTHSEKESSGPNDHNGTHLFFSLRPVREREQKYCSLRHYYANYIVRTVVIDSCPALLLSHFFNCPLYAVFTLYIM